MIMFKTLTTETALETALALACEHAELLQASGVAAEVIEASDWDGTEQDWSEV